MAVATLVGLGGAVADGEQSIEFSCNGSMPAGALEGTCETQFLVPHFDGDDEVSFYGGSVHSVLAQHWRVAGDVWDATGTHYLSWYCRAEASTVLNLNVNQGCGYSRPPFVNTLGVAYEADVSGPQRVRVVVTADSCAEFLLGCPFTSHVGFDLHA
jgi:hypothetical protein